MNLFKLKSQEPDPDDEDSIEGERALTSVNKGVTLQNRITNWAVMIGICALTGILLYKYYAGMYRDYEHKKTRSRTSHVLWLQPRYRLSRCRRQSLSRRNRPLKHSTSCRHCSRHRPHQPRSVVCLSRSRLRKVRLR
jgi:hypothetical protein